MRSILLLLAALLLPVSAVAQNSPPKIARAEAGVSSLPGQSGPPHSFALPSTQYALNLKGFLKDSSGAPLADGTYSLQFRLYTVSDRNAPNTPVYLETQTVSVFSTAPLVSGQSTANRKGKYAVSLGLQNGNPLNASLFRNQTLWMEIWINGQQPPTGVLRQQIIQVPADSTVGQSMNRVVWVTNALNHLEQNNALETAALAFYTQQIYAAIPNADPNFVTRSLIRAEAAFSQRYRSPQTGQFRVTTNPLDAVVNMYGILIQQPGNPVTLPVIGESLNFAAGSLNLMQGQYQQFSYELGRMSSTATFNSYSETQLEGLYLLARQNPKAAIVVNTFFSYGYNAKTTDSLFTILNNNTPLRDSVNFAPLATQIEADGTMLATLDTALTNIADFYDRMTLATQTMNTAISQMTAIQQSDFVGVSNNQTTSAMVHNIYNNAQSTFGPMLQAADPSTYATAQIVLGDQDKYNQLSLAKDGLTLASDIANTAASVAGAIGSAADPFTAGLSVAYGAYAVAGTTKVAADSIQIALDALPDNQTPTGIIKDGLTQLSSQLAGVATQLNSRLDIIDANQLALYNQTNANFAALNNSLNQSLAVISMRIDDLVNGVVAVQYSLDRLTQDFSTFATQAQRANSLVPALTVINNWASDPVALKPSTDTFNTYFSACQTYATSTDLQPSLENGNLAMDGFNSLYGDTDIASQLDSNEEKNLNYLLAFASARFFHQQYAEDKGYFTAPAVDPALPHSLGIELANPTAWEMSSIGMMRAATIYPDLGLPYVQNTTAFSGAYSVGSALQNAATEITLQYASGSANTVIQPSPILKDMMLHQNLMAMNLYSALLTTENGATDVATQVANVKTALNNTNSPVSLAVKALNGSATLLRQFMEFGLSRSVKSETLFSSLLYSAGDPNFRDPQNNAAADPNAQKLPDGTWVQSLYHNWVASQPGGPYKYVTGDPAAIFLNAQIERWSAMERRLDGNIWSPDLSTLTGHDSNSVLDVLAQNATTNGLLLGEPLANVDAVQNRLSYFLIPTVSGSVLGKPIPGLPANEQPKSLANTAVTMTFRGLNGVFTAPALLDSSGSFTVYVPKDLYTVVVVAPGFLQSFAQAPGQIAGVIDTTSTDSTVRSAIHNVSALLTAGDLTGDNVINNSDLIFLRNALGSSQSSPGYSANYDLNGDGLVDYKDVILLQGALYSTTKSFNWNPLCDLSGPGGKPDGVIDGYDQAVFGAALGSLKSDPAKGGAPSANWNPKCDFNGDGIVDYRDQEILQGKVGTTPSSINWNPLYDLNGDGIINTFNPAVPLGTDPNTDGYLLNAALGSSASSPNWNPLADLNGDGKVDTLDLQMLRSVFGARGQN